MEQLAKAMVTGSMKAIMEKYSDDEPSARPPGLQSTELNRHERRRQAAIERRGGEQERTRCAP